MELNNKYNIRLRLVLDNRTSVASKSHKEKTPRFPVAIGLFWKGATREKISAIDIADSKKFTSSTFKNEQVLIQHQLLPYKNVLVQYNQLIDSMDFWNYNVFKELLSKGLHADLGGSKSINSYFDDKIRALDKDNHGAGKNYASVRNSLTTFYGSMPSFDEITYEFLEAWKAWYNAKNSNKGGGLAKYTTCLKAIFNMRPRDKQGHYPFGKKKGVEGLFDGGSHSPDKFYLPIEAIGLIQNAKLDNKNNTYARDLFMFSYLVAGINLVDIFRIKWDQYDELTNILVWKRRKAMHKGINAPDIHALLPDQAKEIIRKYAVERKKGALIFPEMEGRSYSQELTRRKHFNERINKVVKGILKDAEFEDWDDTTFYTARHSFANHTRQKGVSPEVLKDFMGHADIRMTTTYYGKQPIEMLEKVRDIFNKTS